MTYRITFRNHRERKVLFTYSALTEQFSVTNASTMASIAYGMSAVTVTFMGGVRLTASASGITVSNLTERASPKFPRLDFERVSVISTGVIGSLFADGTLWVPTLQEVTPLPTVGFKWNAQCGVTAAGKWVAPAFSET